MLPRPPALRHTALALAATAAILLPASAQSTTRVSVDSWGVEGSADSSSPSISANGRYVAFESLSNLVGSGSYHQPRIFLRDQRTGGTSLVSVNSAGAPASEGCYSPAISGDGQLVAFTSHAGNLGNPSFVTAFVYLHNRQTRTTTRMSVNANGEDADLDSHDPVLSADGRFLAFASSATNLILQDTNQRDDIFVIDLQTGTLTRVSVDSSGLQANHDSSDPSISADGRMIAFRSRASNLVAADRNGFDDIFVHDRLTGQTTLASISTAGNQTSGSSRHPDLSADGRFVAFWYGGEVMVRDLLIGRTTLESKNSAGNTGNLQSYYPSISSTGRYVAFSSDATNLVPGDLNGQRDCFVRDRRTGELTILSVSTAGTQGNGFSEPPALADDAMVAIFASRAANLVNGDANGCQDLFAYSYERRPYLIRSGWTDAMVDLSIADATPGGQVAVLYGPPGQFTRLAGPCTGVVLNLSTPHLATLLTADAAGAAAYSFFAPANANGLAVQVVDLVTCMASGTASLDSRVFRLEKSGFCSGGFALSLSVSEATPFSTVALLYGSTGSYVKSAGACAGLTINLSAPTLLATVTTNSAGVGQYHFTPPPGLCGLLVQGVELGDCVLTNVVIL